MVFRTHCPSPLGPLVLESDGEHLTGLWMQTQAIPQREFAEGCTLPVLRQTTEWLARYFQGEAPDPGELPLRPARTEFQRRVYAILLTIPYCETTTYGAIARKFSPTMSAQAVGGAVGRNPIGIIIPCHRVVGAKGRLTGYAGGLENKQWLLRHEEETK